MVRDLERAGVEVADLKEAFAVIAQEGADTGQRFTEVRSGRLRGTVRGNRAKNKAVITFGRASVPYAGPYLYGWPARHIKPATTIEQTDRVMDDRAPFLFDQELGRLFDRYGF